MNRRIRHGAILAVASLLVSWPARAQDNRTRFEAGPVLGMAEESGTLTEQGGGRFDFLLGGRFTYNWLPHLSLEAESTVSPENLGEGVLFGGHAVEALFGVESGIQFKRLYLFAKVRPGFLHYTDTIQNIFFTRSPPMLQTVKGTRTYAAYDIGGGLKLNLSRKWLLRYDFSDLIATRAGVTFQDGFIGTSFFPGTVSHNFQFSTGIAFRF